jgi:hypothetical protein
LAILENIEEWKVMSMGHRELLIVGLIGTSLPIFPNMSQKLMKIAQILKITKPIIMLSLLLLLLPEW